MKKTDFIRFKPFWFGFLILLLVIVSGVASASQSAEIMWQALKRGEALALIRHSYAPGAGDPPRFLLQDCSTQRNLSEDGRIHSRKIGDFFRAQGIKDALVYSSQWSRCLETAKLLGLGPVEELPALNFFFEEPAREPEQTAEIRTFISALIQQAPVILVTHQVNITALTGVVPSSGEIIILQKEKNGLGKLLGRFIP